MRFIHRFSPQWQLTAVMSSKGGHGVGISRRIFLKGCALALPGLMLAAPRARLEAASTERSLSFYHTHTDERLNLVYHDGAQYLPRALQEINRFLRDFRTEEVRPIDPRLLDILSAICAVTESHGTIEVISGYRSPTTNRMLRNKSIGVAKKSLHMRGKAIDLRLTDVDSANLRKAAVALGQGGVGYYRKSDFVHLDTGRFRTW
jgi:uncharacterized protein YcbK (DUF882 family)